MRSSVARESGGGILKSGALPMGIVLHRFDHIESGALSPVGPRA